MFRSTHSYNVSKAAFESADDYYPNSKRLEEKNNALHSYINPSFTKEDEVFNNNANESVIEMKNPKYMRHPSLTARKSLQPELTTVVRWTDLKVSVNDLHGSKVILDKISGEVNNLEIMAILGPSGAGKSTLLNTIAGKVKNFEGQVKFYSKTKHISFAYVPQVDELSPFLTVKEALLLSSRLKNPRTTNHEEEVEEVLNSFNLAKCKNHFASKCSGGERKRLSIGLEMISQPKILILDEPTSGLDSTTSYKVIEVLKNINRDTVVITTIHQPSSKLFQLFDKVYILTMGKCIFSDSPSLIVDHFAAFGAPCPTFTNPADFVLDVANDVRNQSGRDLVEKMHQHQMELTRPSQGAPQDGCPSRPTSGPTGGQANGGQPAVGQPAVGQPAVGQPAVGQPAVGQPAVGQPAVGKTPLMEISRAALKQPDVFIHSYPLLLKKFFLSAARDPQQSLFRSFNNLLLPLILYFMITGSHGTETGCSFVPANSTHILYETVYDRLDRQETGTQNTGLTFLDLMFSFFSTLVPAILSLSSHINVLKKEHLNSYYSVPAFYYALITVNILLTLVFSSINALSFFFLTGQVFTWVKFLYFWLIVVVSALIGDFVGFSLSVLYPKKNLSALVIGGFVGFGLHCFNGFFVPTGKMVYWVNTFSNLIICRHSFEIMVKIFYGHERCRIGDQMIFSFDQLLDFIDYYNHETNNSLQVIEKIPLKVRNSLEEKPWRKESIFELAEALNELDSDGLDRLQYFWDYKTSYIMEQFSIDTDDLAPNFLVIVVTLVIFLFYCYFLLALKLRK